MERAARCHTYSPERSGVNEVLDIALDRNWYPASDRGGSQHRRPGRLRFGRCSTSLLPQYVVRQLATLKAQ